MTVVAAALLALATLLLAGAARLGAAAVARARVETAADAAALAAADALALGWGWEAAREAAEQTAAANGARLRSCTCTGRVVDVEVQRRFSSWVGLPGTVEARARAEIRPLPPVWRGTGG